MDEKRLHKRTDLHSKVTLKLISETKEERTVEAELTNVSKDGIGFLTKDQLLVGSVFQSVIELWTKQKIDVLLKIVRCEEVNGQYEYGSIFVGMRDHESMRILIYQMFNEGEEN